MNVQHGMTLLELMVTIGITMLLVIVATPAWLTTKNDLQLKHAVEASYFLMQHGRSSAIASGQNVFVSFTPGENWCLGLNTDEPCECAIADSCHINALDMSVSQQDFSAVSLINLHFGDNASAIFDGARGMAMGNAGSVVFSDNDIQAKLIVSNMGRVRICVAQGELGGYPLC
ncbi:MAG: prepilin peptidase dependent protein A [Paraglaciecola sp.]|jgi:prepilin peptidase dependent protein A